MSRLTITIRTDQREAVCGDELPVDLRTLELDDGFPVDEAGELLARCLLSSGIRNPVDVMAQAFLLVLFERPARNGLDEEQNKLTMAIEQFTWASHDRRHPKADPDTAEALAFWRKHRQDLEPAAVVAQEA